MAKSSNALMAGPLGGVVRWFTSRDAIFIALLVAFIVIQVAVQPRFGSPKTVYFLLLDAIPILMLALPMTFIIISAEIDLSVASMVGLSAATIGALTMRGTDFGVTVVVAVLVGLACGALNGFLIAFVGLPSLAVTIGTLALYRGLALVVIGDNSVGDFPKALTDLVATKIGDTGIPLVAVPVLVLILIFGVILSRTSTGRGLYALGFSAEAAGLVGVRVQRVKFWLYVVSGLVASLVGVYWALRYASARSDSAAGLELAVVAAVLLGGISIFGGKGTITGAVAGVLMIATIGYALKLQRVPSEILIVVTGTLLIVSVVGPNILARAKEHVRTARERKLARP